jgi:exonuclease III
MKSIPYFLALLCIFLFASCEPQSEEEKYKYRFLVEIEYCSPDYKKETIVVMSVNNIAPSNTDIKVAGMAKPTYTLSNTQYVDVCRITTISELNVDNKEERKEQ